MGKKICEYKNIKEKPKRKTVYDSYGKRHRVRCKKDKYPEVSA